MKNDIFWSEIGSGFGKPGGTLPTKNSQEYPTGVTDKFFFYFYLIYFFFLLAVCVFDILVVPGLPQ